MKLLHFDDPLAKPLSEIEEAQLIEGKVLIREDDERDSDGEETTDSDSEHSDFKLENSVNCSLKRLIT